MTPIKSLVLILLGGAVAVACDKKESSVIQLSPEPDSVALMLCAKKKQGEIWSSEYEKGVVFEVLRSECNQNNPTALLIAKCTYEYAEYIKDLDKSSTERAEKMCKMELQQEALIKPLNSVTGK